MKEENTTHFEVWLAAYESRLVEIKQGKCAEPQKPAAKPDQETEAPPKQP